jgi:glutamate---cysteine ligase / carboxylate-amine ligase
MEVNFGRSAPFSLGVEEEFQLVSAESYDLVSRYDEVAAAAADERVKPELMQSTVEVATGVTRSVAEAMADVAELRQRLAAAAAERGARIASAGTHPFARWEHQEITDAKRYAGLVEKMQWVAEQELIFGLHVHVGVPSADAAIAVANALRTRLPELLALSVNSPFWQGRDTGLASARTQVFESFPRSGLPPAFGSWDEFELLVERGARTKSFPDYTYIWWDLRPHPRLGTIEIRVCDAQTRLESVAALVALVQSLVATLVERYEREGRLPVESITLIGENKWRAARYGLDANLVWLERDEERAARTAVAELLDLAAPAARMLGCEAELGGIETICTRGTGADEQRRVRDEGGSLLAVVQQLVEQTVEAV